MAGITLSRWQFAVTTIYHFFFVPLTLGLSILVAILETMYVRSGDERYKRMVKFWGKLFLINFAMGVATGIVQEFQFGMNWSEYSRFVGDIFGAPLAIEALVAFFLESTFLGIWIFGWEKLPKGLHAAAIWLVALGSNLSAVWILVANSFMHEPMGYRLAASGRAEMTDFGALLGNAHVWTQWPHVFFSALTTAGFFMLGISAYRVLKKGQDVDLFRRSLAIGLIVALVGTAGVGVMGHIQGQHMIKTQPMKMAAAEALWQTEQPAYFSVLTIGNLQQTAEIWSFRIPYVLSFLACNNFTCKVEGIYDLQAQFEQQYGPGNYVPPVAVMYWAFRFMFLGGLLMAGVALLGLFLLVRKKLENWRWLMRLLPLAIVLPYVANSSGWILTEVGRQPWIVYGLMKTVDGVSPVPGGTVLFSLLAFVVLYGALMAADVYLLSKAARQEVAAE